MNPQTESLRTPISDAAPCGVDLEDTQILNAFDAFRLFGNAVPLPADTDWREIRNKSVEALAQSRDLRLLAHFGAAIARTDGLGDFCDVLVVADEWLRQWWPAVFPKVDEDAILRKNAVTSFADRMGVVDAIRRLPIVTNRQLGAYSLRDLELANGQLAPTESDGNAPSTGQIEAAFEGSPVEELESRGRQVAAGVAAIRGMVATMQTQGGFEATPDLDALLNPLSRVEKLLNDHLLHRTGAGVPATDDTAAEADAVGSGMPVGNIKSRQDAIRAIDAAAAFFRKNEPSSPVPLLLDRAKRLVSKSFLEVLEDIAPDSLTQVRVVSGIKPEES